MSLSRLLYSLRSRWEAWRPSPPQGFHQGPAWTSGGPSISPSPAKLGPKMELQQGSKERPDEGGASVCRVSRPQFAGKKTLLKECF